MVKFLLIRCLKYHGYYISRVQADILKIAKSAKYIC